MRCVACALILIPLFAVPAYSEPGYDIIIEAGQSNAHTFGRGPFTDPYYSEAIDARIKQLGRRGSQNMQVVPVGDWVNGVKTDGLQNWNWSPGSPHIKGFVLTFARRY